MRRHHQLGSDLVEKATLTVILEVCPEETSQDKYHTAKESDGQQVPRFVKRMEGKDGLVVGRSKPTRKMVADTDPVDITTQTTDGWTRQRLFMKPALSQVTRRPHGKRARRKPRQKKEYL